MSGFERKKLKNGEDNPKYIDLLDEDKPIAGQKFACISFVSPEQHIKNRELFYFENFLRNLTASSISSLSNTSVIFFISFFVLVNFLLALATTFLLILFLFNNISKSS